MKLSLMSAWLLPLLLLLVVLLSNQLAQASVDLIHHVPDFSRRGVEHPYGEINKDLCKNLKSDEYEENAALLTEWYEKVADQKKFFLDQSKLRAAALQLITEFERQRKAATWCQGERVEQVGRLNKQEVKRHVVALRRRQPKGMLVCNRLLEIFFMQTLTHLEDCPRFYQDNVRNTVLKLNEFTLSKGNIALKPLIGKLQRRLKVEEFSFDLVLALSQQLADDKFEPVLIELAAESVSQFVQRRVRDLIFHLDEAEDRVFQQLNDKIYQPCTYVSSNLRAILGPASLDLENLNEFWEGGKELPEAEQQFRSYGRDVYKIWAKYLVCNKLLELNYAKLGEVVKGKVDWLNE